MKLSIAICTYNRSEHLKNALNSLMPQINSQKEVELLVIDNNSTDNTSEVVEYFFEKINNFKYVNEKEQGISYARNRAFRHTESEYVGYIDDDAKASENFIVTALNIIDKYSPDVFGGPIYPFYLDSKPEWFHDKYETRIHHSKSGLFKKGSLSASNLFISRKTYNTVGHFSTEYGGSGIQLVYGEETEFIERARKAGFETFYNLDLKVLHWVPQYKMNVLYILMANYRMGKSYQSLKKNLEDGSMYKLIDYMDLFFSELNRELKSDEKLFERRFVEQLAGTFNLIGQQAAHIRDNNSENEGITEIEMQKYDRMRGKRQTFLSFIKQLICYTKEYLKQYRKK